MKKHPQSGFPSGQDAGVRQVASRSVRMPLSEQAERRVASLLAAILATLALLGLVIWSMTGQTTLNRIAAPPGIASPFQQQDSA